MPVGGFLVFLKFFLFFRGEKVIVVSRFRVKACVAEAVGFSGDPSMACIIIVVGWGAVEGSCVKRTMSGKTYPLLSSALYPVGMLQDRQTKSIERSCHVLLKFKDSRDSK